jgi:hypothetical protein
MNERILHKNLAAGRWYELSLAEQMDNIGSEVGRAAKTQNKDEARFWNAVVRAQELFFLTLADKHWGERRKEIARAYEVFCDAVLGGKVYGSDLESLDRYFIYFALSAMRQRQIALASFDINAKTCLSSDTFCTLWSHSFMELT